MSLRRRVEGEEARARVRVRECVYVYVSARVCLHVSVFL